MTRKAKPASGVWRVGLLLLLAWLLYAAGREFQAIAWGTGNWVGEYSPKWLSAYAAYILISLACLVFFTRTLFRPQQVRPLVEKLLGLREALGFARWPLTAALLISPVLLLQYSDWGVVVNGFYLRVLIWGVAVLLATILITPVNNELATWPGLLSALLLSGTVISLGAALTNVTDYPFSLGWSEGNRLYDYSLLFGSRRYMYSGLAPRPFLDIGRELLGGLPFILPNLNILGARLWLAILAVIPYLLFGWVAFSNPGASLGPKRSPAKQRRVGYILAAVGALWAFLFVKQGPVHPPLLLCAILVALAWRRPLWLALPLVVAAGYFAQVSRGTWMFAPAMWIAMLEFTGEISRSRRVGRAAWLRTIALSAAGLFGGVLLPIVQRWVMRSSTIVSIPWTDQPLLWYRLLPNATYGHGILLGLLLATGPLLAILVYLVARRRWNLNGLQQLLIIGSLLAFLIVGLIVSTKIGGGGDLHNMDMFILGLVFSAAVAWHSGTHRWIVSLSQQTAWVRAALVLMLVIPALRPLGQLRPLETQNEPWLFAIMDVKTRRSLSLLPSKDTAEDSLAVIRAEVDAAKARGEVLFMDQRQLLTFGYITDIPLIAEYEKKLLMNAALSADASFFAPFYEDLQAARFDLIVTEPLFTPIKDADYVFGEENNAWVEWVSKPVLCYYEPIEWLVEVRVQLLVPRPGNPDCASLLPAVQ